MASLVITKKERIGGRVYSYAKCHCGADIILEGFTNQCDKCERQYNWHGMPLAPERMWGEETGEHWADVARIE
jgi:hypothetical protein